MKTKYFLLLQIVFPIFSSAQIINTAVMDTSDLRYNGKVAIEGYVDLYYAYNFNRPNDGDQPYLISMARHNETN